MDIYFTLYPLLFILLINFIAVSYVKRPSGSDQAVHLLLIKLIKNNSHKFVTNIEPYLFGYECGYPQLYHWFLSFLSDNSLKIMSKYSPLYSNILSITIHISFTFFIAKQLELNSNFILYSMILFLSSAIIFNKQNARNLGISGRSVGLILGQLYMVLIYLYFLSNNSIFLPLLVLLILIIILTSQFTTQFVIFMSMILSIIFFEIWLICTVLVAFLLFYLLFPKSAVVYFKFQWKHKKYYFNYGTKLFLLPNRKSIWGDFIIGFWKKVRIDVKKGLFYIFYNPVIIVLSGMPIIFFVLYAIIQKELIQKPTNNIIDILITISLSSVLIFIITSFKFTRFLGEPERYIDFTVMSFSVLGAILFYNNPIIILIASSIGLIRIILDIFISKYVKKFKKSPPINLMKKQVFSGSDPQAIRLLSNDLEITKMLLNSESKFFYGWSFYLSDLYDIFKIYKNKIGIINQECIIPLVLDYSINYLILDSRHFSMELSHKSLAFNKVGTIDDFVLFKVRSITIGN